MRTRRFSQVLSFVVLSALAHSAGAQNYNLDFSGLGPNGATIPSSYGDVAGVVDVSIGHRSGWGNTSLMEAVGYAWDKDYNDLLNVAYTKSGPGVGEIALNNLKAGESVTFNSASVGAWPDRAALVGLRVYDSDWNELFNQTGTTTPFTSVSFTGSASSLSQLYIQWSQDDGSGNPIDAYNVGIDNVNFTIGDVTVTPEPGAAWLLLTGLTLACATSLRRKSVTRA